MAKDQYLSNERFISLAMEAAKASDKNLKRICTLALYWSNDLLDVVLDFYKLEHPPSQWMELDGWQQRIMPILNQKARSIKNKIKK